MTGSKVVLAISLVLAIRSPVLAAPCKRICQPAIQRCVNAGYRRRACKRQLVGVCKQAGRVACDEAFLPATTTTTPTTTTTITTTVTVPTRITSTTTTATITTTTTTVPTPECVTDADCLTVTPCQTFMRCAAGTCVPAPQPMCPDGSVGLWVGQAMSDAGTVNIAATLCSAGKGQDYALSSGAFLCAPTADCPTSAGGLTGTFLAHGGTGGVSALTSPAEPSLESAWQQQALLVLEQNLAATRSYYGSIGLGNSASELIAEAEDVATDMGDLANVIASNFVASPGPITPCLFAGTVANGTIGGSFACGTLDSGSFALAQCP